MIAAYGTACEEGLGEGDGVRRDRCFVKEGIGVARGTGRRPGASGRASGVMVRVRGVGGGRRERPGAGATRRPAGAAGGCRDAEAAVVPCACVRGGSRRQDHRGRGLGTEGEISGLIQSLAFDAEDLETDGANQPVDGRQSRGRRTKGWDDEGKKSDPYSHFSSRDKSWWLSVCY